jgi:hypothetical protein
MIVCRQCGDRSEDGTDFCSNCGSFLEFTGEKLATAPPPAPAATATPTPSPQPAPAPHGLIDRVKAAVRGEPGPGGDEEGEPAVAVTGTISPRRKAAATDGAAAEVDLTGRPATVPAAISPPTGAAATAAHPAAAPAAGAPPPPAPPSTAPPAAQPPPSAVPRPTTTSAPERRGSSGETITRQTPAGTAPPVTVPTPATPLPSPPAAWPPAAPVAPAAAQPTVVAPQRPAVPAAQQPVAMQPAAARPRPAHRPVGAPSPPSARADDLVCAQCGERSARDRRFCRRCGASLLTVGAAPPPPRPPWWRRILGRLRRHPSDDAEGTRSRRPSVLRRLADFWRRKPGLLALAALVLFVIGLNPTWRSQIAGAPMRLAGEVRRTVAPAWNLVDATAQASAEVPGHQAKLAVDGWKGTYWAAPAGTSEATWPTLTITLSRAADLDKIGFTAGASADPQASLARPRDVRLVFSDGRTTDLQLGNVPDFQLFDVEGHRITSVRIQIRSVWPQAATTVALAEVELFERQ